VRDEVLLRQVDDNFTVQSFDCFFRVKLAADLCLLHGGAICRLLGLGGEMGTEGPEMMSPGAVCLMETKDDESDADR
jgi:hypothetical protein